MRMTMKTSRAASLAAPALVALLAISACDRSARLEVRTFELEHLHEGEARDLIDPYVYGNRADAPGAASITNGALTVRETSDNLERIASVLAEFDRPRPDTRLLFQLIEADGFEADDPRIATVEAELRKLFQFRGYRLAAEALVSSADRTEVQQQLRDESGELYLIEANLYRQSSNVVRLEEVTLWGPDGTPSLRTTVTIRPGQTLVLGSSPKQGSAATLFLTVRAESEADGPGGQQQ